MNNITVSILLLACTIIFGAIGFNVIDHYPPIDALYMSVITVTTVGFGEIYPLSEWGRLFAIVFILVGFVVLGFVGHSLFESLLEKVWSGDALERKMKKEIALLNKHSIICGFGRVGEVAADHLKNAGVDFVVIENTEQGIESCKAAGLLYVQGDATRESVLLKAGIKNAVGLLAMLNSDPLNLFVVLTARELNPTLHIIARSEERHTEKKILRAGADSIISPFDSAGQKIASDLISVTHRGVPLHIDDGSQHDFIDEMVTVSIDSDLIGKSINELNEKFRVLGLRRKGEDLLYPDGALLLQDGDRLLLLRPSSEGEVYLNDIKAEKIVIVDDNPVILRLFSRLFQKEGYHPISADDGETGLKLILSEKPVVAVIDYMLPGMSGVDLCRKLKKESSEDSVKLVIFTAEEDRDVRQQCLDAGADRVIVKSADASEIIKTVKELLA